MDDVAPPGMDMAEQPVDNPAGDASNEENQDQPPEGQQQVKTPEEDDCASCRSNSCCSSNNYNSNSNSNRGNSRPLRPTRTNSGVLASQAKVPFFTGSSIQLRVLVRRARTPILHLKTGRKSLKV